MFYAHDERLNLYFLSEERTRHGQNLLANPRVAANHPGGPAGLAEHSGVQVRGEARIATGAERTRAIAAFGRKFAFVAALLVGAEGPRTLTGPLAQARFWVLRPNWFRLIDNTVRFGFKEELILE